MKFSVLLPTRNRLDLLKYAIATVMRQDYDDWEIIVSDNFSEDDIAGYIQSLKEQRIKYYRTERFIPVTDNWNNALEKSSGDYVIMLGDDDCLMKGYFKTIHGLLETYTAPDFIYTSALLYAYPGVMPGFPDGFLNPYGRADFLKAAKEPFWLDKGQAVQYVNQSMNFKLPFDYNMQFSAISRKFIQSLGSHGTFFQSPYPDFYAHNVMFLKAERILICPIPLVTIGISPKSYGFYYFNKQEKQGADFLQNIPRSYATFQLRNVVLPGTDVNTSWLFSMEAVKTNYGTEFDLQVNYRRYRFLQIFYMYSAYYRSKRCSRNEFHEFLRMMRPWEKIVYGSSLWLSLKAVNIVPRNLISKIGWFVWRLLGQYPAYKIKTDDIKYKNILEVFEKVDPLRGIRP
jgi:glycosyltransferase involved in cell wall biosynthesis